MGVLKLRVAEKKLFKNVEHGDETVFSERREIVSAEVLRHIILGLPLTRRGFRPLAREIICKTTGAGISLSNAIICGPLRLEAAIGCQGGSLCPLEFRSCTFTKSFLAAHAHFSRLSFRNCDFIDDGERVDPASKRILPTVDLAGAKLDTHLDMEGIHSSDAEGVLWIRAQGISVSGGINLSKCALRAPYRRMQADALGKIPAKERDDALDLTQAEIAGDFSLDDGSKVYGRLKLRGTRIGGDMWLDTTKFMEPGEDAEALFLQGARIEGFLSMTYPNGDRGHEVDCRGSINLIAAEVGRSLLFKHVRVEGDIQGHDLIVRDDFFLHAHVQGTVGLVRASIGGSLDISELQIENPDSPPSGEGNEQKAIAQTKPAISLKDGRIGGALRLTTKAEDAGPPLSLAGVVDLRGLTCDTLDDEIGQKWGKNVLIHMNHFTYRRTGWLSNDHPTSQVGRRKKDSQKIVGDWVLSHRAAGDRPWRWFPLWSLPKSKDFWDPWQLRRNWIYQQYESDETRAAIVNPFLSISRHKIWEDDYRPQPFEQAIRVARAEGREDFATQFEIHKQALEWRLFNLRVRWILAGIAITLAALWLCLHSQSRLSVIATAVAWLMTMVLMTFGSWLRTRLEARMKALRPRGSEEARHRVSKWATWIGYYLPALALLVAFWIATPFHYLVALVIFLSIRWLGVFAHGVIGFGFGYLRRPILAVVTLIGAFLVGWWGVDLANSRGMFVIAAEPVAGLVAPVEFEHPPEAGHEPSQLMGSERATPDRWVRDLSCSHEISRPLYALDVLIPIVDLGEESRCEIRRFPSPHHSPVYPAGLSFGQLWASRWDLPLSDHRFWWWMKAIYAIAGWIIVSLSILTFAQVNKTHAEPPTEHQ